MGVYFYCHDNGPLSVPYTGTFISPYDTVYMHSRYPYRKVPYSIVVLFCTIHVNTCDIEVQNCMRLVMEYDICPGITCSVLIERIK